jgi:FAD/FMN-containing dehydrogenase
LVTTPCVVSPATIDELSEILRGPGPFVISGGESERRFRLPTPFAESGPSPATSQWTRVETRQLRGIIEHHSSDQVVVVRAGSLLGDVQQELEATGQTLPIGAVPGLLPGSNPTVGGLISMNLPHVLNAECGSWRDWVLGMTTVLADGTVAKCGSQAVKNVAGYDVQKLFIGARGTLGVVAEVILRTYPLAAMPDPDVVAGPHPQEAANWIQRTQRSDFENCLAGAGARLVAASRTSSTLWAMVSPEESLPRFQNDWVIRGQSGETNLQITDPTQIMLMKRTKDIFDPTRKLNPGEMGVF